MTLLQQIQQHKEQPAKQLTNEEKEVIKRFYDKSGRIKTLREFDLTPNELTRLKKEWGLV